ncbi:hypothetical protein [Bacillus sp. B15-48]|uniref:hypothetical protein n=1 Tax=Bacillus sp. B15-48 TaxID=1548601 RepID=UPI00193F39A2|nr:hypothetical protein [Bacillus sp. B15-48]MBM4762749.1 hypothetical protein [Bacillus sp. B15-48]
MKKLFRLLLLGLLSIALVACGSDATSISDDSETTEQGNKDEGESETNQTDTQENEEVVTDEDVQEDDQLKATNTYTNKELGIEGTSGPMEYTISGIQLKKLEPKTEATAALFDAEVGDVVHGFTIKMSGENTSEEDINFYLGQATAITNTKEQLDSDMFLSEYIDGKYLGQVRHEGYNFYILKNSTVDELESIEIRIDGPSNNNYDSVGDDIKHVIEVNN